MTFTSTVVGECRVIVRLDNKEMQPVKLNFEKRGGGSSNPREKSAGSQRWLLPVSTSCPRKSLTARCRMPNDHPSPELHDAILATALRAAWHLGVSTHDCRHVRGLCWRPSCTVVVLVLHRET